MADATSLFALVPSTAGVLQRVRATMGRGLYFFHLHYSSQLLIAFGPKTHGKHFKTFVTIFNG